MEPNQEFNLDAFLAGMERDKSKGQSDPSTRLNKVLMNTQDNQGIVSFIPFLSKNYSNFYLKIPRVCEFYGNTTLLNSGEGWMKLLPIEFYGQLNSDEIQLYQDVKKLFNELGEYESVSFDEWRIRTYSLFTGIQISHKSNKGKVLDELNDCACLYVFPSNSPIDAMDTSIQSKIDAMKGNRNWLSAIFSPANKGRKGLMQIAFNKSSGAGYDANVSFEINSEYNIFVDPEKEYSENTVKLFDDAMSVFMGWNYDRDADRMFNTTYMKEFKLALENRLEGLKASEVPLPTPEGDKLNKSSEVPSQESEVNQETTEPKAETPTKKVPF